MLKSAIHISVVRVNYSSALRYNVHDNSSFFYSTFLIRKIFFVLFISLHLNSSIVGIEYHFKSRVKCHSSINNLTNLIIEINEKIN